MRFIHEDDDDNRLQNMAELLDTLSVRRIMETETEERRSRSAPILALFVLNGLSIIIPLTGLLSLGVKEILSAICTIGCSHSSVSETTLSTSLKWN